MSNGPKARSELRTKIVARLLARRPEIVQAIHTRILEAVPDSTNGRDPAYRAGLLAAVSAVLDYGLEAIEQGSTRPGSVPQEAAAQARRAARAGVEPGAVIRRYVAGHGRLGAFIAEEAGRPDVSGDRTALHDLHRTQEALLERLLAVIEREHVEERERMTRIPDQRLAVAEEPVQPPDLVELHGSHPGVIAVALGRFDALLARGLRQILSDDPRLQIVDTDLGNAALERIVAPRAPLIALLDEEGVTESSVLSRLRASQPTIGIVVLAHRPARACGMQLLAAGASCLPKDASAADILAAVYLAAEGRRLFAPGDGYRVERRFPATAISLTPRETDVFECLSRGESHGEVALTLQIGVETARKHAAHIYRKLGVRSKRELVGMPVPTRSQIETY